jgi:hypothetical protein
MEKAQEFVKETKPEKSKDTRRKRDEEKSTGNGVDLCYGFQYDGFWKLYD